jgi:hypothetical protein
LDSLNLASQGKEESEMEDRIIIHDESICEIEKIEWWIGNDGQTIDRKGNTIDDKLEISRIEYRRISNSNHEIIAYYKNEKNEHIPGRKYVLPIDTRIFISYQTVKVK